jgi:phosphatidylglycerophosphate synthase
MSRQQSLNSWRGYLAASLGGATGAVVLTAICLLLAYVYVRTQNNGGLEGLAVLLLSSYAGFGIGEVLGCWLALRWGGYASASRTTNLLAGLTFFAVLVFFSNIPMAFTKGINAAFWLLVGLTAITLPLLARFLAR